jgi:hypothetical protein
MPSHITFDQLGVATIVDVSQFVPDVKAQVRCICAAAAIVLPLAVPLPKRASYTPAL